jgi:hypothetical protein
MGKENAVPHLHSARFHSAGHDPPVVPLVRKLVNGLNRKPEGPVPLRGAF